MQLQTKINKTDILLLNNYDYNMLLLNRSSSMDSMIRNYIRRCAWLSTAWSTSDDGF